jgi:hypothetical protein
MEFWYLIMATHITFKKGDEADNSSVAQFA